MKHYVSPIGNSALGTKEHPLSLQYALDGADGLIKGGDTIELLPGIYKPETPYLLQMQYDTPITIIGNEDAFIYGSTELDATRPSGIFKALGGKGYIFKDLYIYGNNPLRNSSIKDGYVGNSAGFSLQHGSDIDIINCHIENTTADCIYKSSAFKNLNVIGNILRYSGHYSKEKGRYAHHGLYLQNEKGSYCNIEKNMIIHSLTYGTQVWHQSGPHKQESKLIDVVFKSNIFISNNETALLYGGNNFGKGGKVINNSIYAIDSNGLRIGYSVAGGSNTNSDFIVANNVIHGNLKIINPVTNADITDRVHVENNIISRPGYTFSIFTNRLSSLTSVVSGWINNTLIATSKRPFQWVNNVNRDGRSVQEFNRILTLDEMYSQGLPPSNIVMTSHDNFIRYVDNTENDKLFIAVHNFENLNEIEIDTTPYFVEDKDLIVIYDAENMAEYIYEGEAGVIAIDMEKLPDIEKPLGNVETPPKSDSNFVALVIEKIGELDDDPVDPIEDPPVCDECDCDKCDCEKEIKIINNHYKIIINNIAQPEYYTELSEALDEASDIKKDNPDKAVEVILDKGSIRIELG